MLRGASSKGHIQREGGCAVVRRGHLTAVVGTFLIGCAVLLLGLCCAGTSSETSKKAQEPTEAIQKEQTRSPEATASEEARCQGTRPFQQQGVHLTTNDLPECPKGGPLLGADKADKSGGKEGDDEIRGLGAADQIFGGVGNHVISAGPGNDFNLTGDDGDVVIYGGDGNDFIFETRDRGHDKLYCGEGKDKYAANKNDFVSSSCEKKAKLKPPRPSGAGRTGGMANFGEFFLPAIGMWPFAVL
jgi:hypothetical protein